MAIFSDTHMHSSFSADSSTPMEEQIKGAIGKNLKTICFTEHIDLDSPYRNMPAEDRRAFNVDYDLYRDTYNKLRNIYSDRIEILFGAELGLNYLMKDVISAYGTHYRDFDYIIGSTHSCDDCDPYYDSFYDRPDPRDAFRTYFETSLENVRAFDCYDSYGHLDYVLRYGPVSADGSCPERTSAFYYMYFKDIIDEMLRIIIDNGKALEINTKSLSKNSPETNPGKSILRRYKELGGEMITVGSDAHEPSGISFGFSTAESILKDCGFKYYTVFRNRIPSQIPLS